MLSPFEVFLMDLEKEASELKKKEVDLSASARLFNEKLQGFLKQHGLSDNFSIPELCLLAIRKSRG